MEPTKSVKHSDAYKLGWNVNNDGGSFLANPFSCIAFDGFLYDEWRIGYEDNQKQWNDPEYENSTPQSYQGLPTIDQIVKNHAQTYKP